MQKRRTWTSYTLLSVFIILSLLLSACGATPTATPTTAPKPTATTAAAAPTATKAPAAPTTAPAAAATTAPAAPTATKAPAAPTAAPTTSAAGAPKKGGKIVFGVWQSPTTLNWNLNSQTVMNEILAFVTDGLLDVLPNGSYTPALAKEVPTVQNGGVSADGKTITYKLKEGLKWSDGTVFGCEDVKFTWEATMVPGNAVVQTSGYSDIESITCPDANTVVIKFKNFYAAYLNLFPIAIYPKNAGAVGDMKNWAYNRKPLGTGPFKVDEWVADDHVTLSRNPNYREAGKPYLDQVIVRIVPSSEVAMQLLSSGEIDVMWNNTEADIPQLAKMAGVKTQSPVQIGGERLFLNMAENKDPSDPTKPHLILSDVRVRQAIGLGINKQRIIDKLLNGKALPGSSELNAGYFQCTDIKAYAYDPEQAKKLLEQAGWVPGPDGIRVAKGAKNAPDGTKLRLKYSTTSGNKLREDSQVLVVEDMKAIGIDMYIENAPSSVVIGSWDASSPRKRGNFDVIMYTTNASLDPHTQMMNLWATKNIPTVDNKNGVNYTRFSDAKADALLAQAAAEPDPAKRKALYCQLTQMTYDQANMIYLYQRMKLDSYRDRLQGWADNAWNSDGWNAEDWWVSK